MVITPLDRKMLRDLWRMRSQAFAIALVIAAGVGMVIMSLGMMRSLETTREVYYDRYRFADIFAPVKRAPQTIVDDIRKIPGVSVAEGRITTGATLDIPGVAEPVTARLHSLPDGGQPRVNALVLRNGRLPSPDAPEEVVVSEKFAKAVRIGPGDSLSAVLYGKRQQLRVVGTAISPEYVYAIGAGQIFPDNRRFGILWMGEEHLAAALDLTDSVNEILVRIEGGASSPEIIRRIDLALEHYGGVSAYPRAEQISDRFLSNELQELRTITGILPPIFLGVAAFLINMVLSRLIDAEREQIGLLMAFGYRGRTIIAHYAKITVALAIPGLGLGLVLGSWLGRGLAGIYQKFFIFPFLQFRVDTGIFIMASLVTLGVVLLGVFQSVRRIRMMTPVEAMRPPLPPGYTGFFAHMLTRMRWLDEPTRIIVRGMARRPFRSVLGSVGVAAALGLYIASAGSTDNVARMIEILFNQSNRADIMVVFAEPRDERALFELSRAPGVLRVEPLRSVGARLSFGNRSKAEALTGIAGGGDLYRPVGIDGTLVDPPSKGLLISYGLARQLGAGPGDLVQVKITEGKRRQFFIPVAGVIKSAVGAPVYIEQSALARLLDEAPIASGAYLAVDPARMDDLFRYLKSTPVVAGMTLRSAAVRGLDETVGETMGIVTLFNTGFSALIVFGVIYNNARISLAERARDLASLRVLGYRRSEVSYILLGELTLLTLFGLPIGIMFGYMLSEWLSGQLGGDLFIVPFALSAATMAKAVLIVMVAAAVTALFVRRQLDRLDLVAVLKSWD